MRWDTERAEAQREVASRTQASTVTWIRGQLARAGSVPRSGQGSLSAAV